MKMNKRSQGFFGLHFDFHAGPDCVEVGKTVTEEMIRDIITTCRPDYIQCDCKGHPGYSSYPTKAGNPAPGFVKDQLAMWRKVTAEFGIPLVMHYSGVWDARAIELHPEWAAIGADGERNTKNTSTFKGYADRLLIPQLVELANEYGVDAAWIDGDCWATVPDFDASVIASFEQKHNVTLTRDVAGHYDTRSPAYRLFLDFCRQQFFNYLSHYVDEVHRQAPGFEIASNWAFSSHIPRPVCANVDFLSGDFSPVDSYNSARFEARVLCEQNMSWDLMAWGFYHEFSDASPYSVKSAEALCREAASVISLGGGIQVYNLQNRDGSVRLWEVRELANVARFVREREPFLKGAKPFSNIGVYYSDHDMRNRSDSLFFSGGHDAAKGAVRLLLDASRTCGVVMDFMLTPDGLKDKDLLILPELQHIHADHKTALLQFVDNGGILILTGGACCKTFEDVLEGVTLSAECVPRKIAIADNNRFVNQYAHIADAVRNNNKSEILKTFMPGDTPAIVKTRRGKGTIVAIFYDLFNVYCRAPDFYVRTMIANIIDNLGIKNCVTYKDPKCVDIATARKNGKLLISLTNTNGIYTESRLRAYDEIVPVSDLELCIQTDPPASVTLQPGDQALTHNYDATTRTLTVRIPRLHIHTMVVIEA